MISVLFVLQIIFAIILTILVLLQKSSSIGLGAYSGSNESLFGAKGPASFLTKSTFVVGTLFILNTVALGYYYNRTHNRSVVDDLPMQATPAKTVPQVPAAAPSQLPQSVPSAPQAPVVPSLPGAAD